MYGRVFFRIPLIFSFLLALGCGPKGESDTDLGSSISPDTPSRGSLHILPERATTRDDLYLQLKGGTGDGPFQWHVNNELVGNGSTRLSHTHFSKGDRVSVSIEGVQRSAEISILNSAPEVTGVTLEPGEFYRGIDVTALPQAFDPDGDPVFFSLQWRVNGETISDAGHMLQGNRFQRGDRLSLKVIPSDGDLEGEAYQTGEITVPNAPPRFVTLPPAVFKSAEYTYAARAHDPDGDSLAFYLDESPPGMKIDTFSGDIHWPLEGASTGKYHISLKVKDSYGGQDIQEFRLDLLPEDGDEKK